MTDDTDRSILATIRLAAWILPTHRKDWAAAMLNEIAYIKSRRAALYWAVGCILSAIRERSSYELEKTLVSHRILKVVLGLSTASIIAIVGVYIVQKPYQRERIAITLHHVLEHGQSHISK